MNTTAELASEIHGENIIPMTISDYTTQHYIKRGLDPSEAMAKFSLMKDKKKFKFHMLHKRTTQESIKNREEEITAEGLEEYVETGYWYFLEDDESSDMTSVSDAKKQAKTRFNKKLNVLDKYYIWNSQASRKRITELEQNMIELDGKYNQMAEATEKIKKLAKELGIENGIYNSYDRL